MMILITYDVSMDDKGASRLRKVAKECVNHGQRVQNSVFECILDMTQYTALKHKIELIINPELDSVRFYFLSNNWSHKVIQVGKITSYDPTAELII